MEYETKHSQRMRVPDATQLPHSLHMTSTTQYTQISLTNIQAALAYRTGACRDETDGVVWTNTLTLNLTCTDIRLCNYMNIYCIYMYFSTFLTFFLYMNKLFWNVLHINPVHCYLMCNTAKSTSVTSFIGQICTL